jgi:predicted dienelactone hydrolase
LDLAHLKLRRSQGYIVAALQHGDGRNYFQCTLAERPLAVTRLLDYLLADPVFGPAIDRERIGISGASLGGYTTLAVAGGGYYGNPLVPADKRFRAAFGLFPLVAAFPT